MENSTFLFFRFCISILIGILVGLQREYEESHSKEIPAGVRTFGIVSLTGCTAAFFSDLIKSPLPFICVVLCLGIFFSISYYIQAVHGKIGLTTKVSLILTLFAGGLAYWEKTLTIAIAISVLLTILLSLKVELHQFVRHLSKSDIIATLKFAVITAIILPILPDRVFGFHPFNIFNPFKLWLFVVFISGVSFIGYILIKVLGTKKGIGITGLLGGLASSTAVTFNFSAKSKENPQESKTFALGIIIAWSIMFLRLAAALAFLNLLLFKHLIIPLFLCFLVGFIFYVFAFIIQKTEKKYHEFAINNPFEISLAIKFGLLFILILFVSRAAQIYLGNNGIFLSSFFAGLADVDAVAYSISKLCSDANSLDITSASQAIIIAAIANTLLKGIVVFFGGSSQLKKIVLPSCFLIIACGSICILFM
jgi:uncharacterized membrane protein (DUF4010 family)